MPDNGKLYVTAPYPEQHDQDADTLGRAFISDPTFKAIIPDITDPVERATRLADLFRGMLAIERRSGQPVFGIVDDNGRVVAAAMTEGIGHPGALGMITTGLGQMPRMVRAIGLGGMWRGLNLVSVLSENHPKEPHLYLQVLGCDPPFQGKGYGKALVDRLALAAEARPEIAGLYPSQVTETNAAAYPSPSYVILCEV